MEFLSKLTRHLMPTLGGAGLWLLGGIAAARVLAPSDLAILLEPSPHGTIRIGMGPDFFPDPWWQASLALYEQTPVGQALTIENTREEWQLVSLRVAPCQPLLSYLTPENERFCAAELRLVWQPIVYSRPGSWMGVADDRAFHVSYRLNGSSGLLDSSKAQAYRVLQNKGLTKAPSDLPSSPLGVEELLSYEELHRELVARLVGEVKALAHAPLDGQEIGVRPEYSEESTRKAFVEGLRRFLRKHARPDQMVELTGFSLTEGRDPPLLDEWIFIALEPASSQGGVEASLKLIPKDILLKSKHSGQPLLNFGNHTTVSMHRDDDRIFDLMESLNDREKLEVESSVIMRFADKKTKKDLIADVKQTQVPHTTCGSCHKLNTQPFDFHNLSYYLDHPVTVSPRVIKDVTHDLSWLKKKGID